MGTMTDTYTTPEGFELSRPLLLPDVTDFADLFTVVRPWDFATMNHKNGVLPHPELVPDPVKIGENELGPYLSLRNVPGRKHYGGFAVVAKQAVVDVIAPRIVTDDDRLSFEVIYHEDNDRCLVLAKHNYIIGSHWLAYIDPATVPTTD